MMYPTPPVALSRRKRIPPEKLSANVAITVGSPRFSKSVVQKDVRLTVDTIREVMK
jgi:hypothetical protein